VWHQDSGAPGSDRDSTPATKVTPQAHRLHLQARPTWPRAVKNAATRCRESLCIFAKARHLKRQSSTRLTMAGLALGEWTRAAVAAGACFSGCQRQDQRFLSTGFAAHKSPLPGRRSSTALKSPATAQEHRAGDIFAKSELPWLSACVRLAMRCQSSDQRCAAHAGAQAHSDCQ
jgi:hypothetical protein